MQREITIRRKNKCARAEENHYGLTRGEILVVFAVMGILLLLAVLSLQSGREIGRDSKRLSDIRQIQAALEIYYQNHNRYPETPEEDGLPGFLGPLPEKTPQCLTESGFLRGADCSMNTGNLPYMGYIPGDPGGSQYIYKIMEGEKSYGIEFQLEGRVSDFPGQTPLCARPKTDIQKGKCL